MTHGTNGRSIRNQRGKQQSGKMTITLQVAALDGPPPNHGRKAAAKQSSMSRQPAVGTQVLSVLRGEANRLTFR
jgi:hypothetical protein